MTFELGEVVTPLSTITFSGTDYPLIGTSGTVTNREQTTFDIEGNAVYIYQVQLFEPLIVGSGISLQSNSTFWLTEGQITGEISGFSPDLTTLQDNLATATASVTDAAATIEQVLAQIPTENPFYYLIENYKPIVESAADKLTVVQVDSSLSPSEVGRDVNTQNRNATNADTDAKITKELTENLFGIFQVVNEIEEDLKTTTTQVKEQEELAKADDAANFNAFYETYVNAEESTNLLVPSETTLPEAVSIDLTTLNDETDINEDMLTVNLELEQD